MMKSTPHIDGRLVKVFICIALSIATLLVYCRAFDHSFVNFDDQEYVYSNPKLTLGLSAAGVRWAFTSFDCANWHPITWLSLLLDHELSGFQPRGYHVTNVLFHI